MMRYIILYFLLVLCGCAFGQSDSCNLSVSGKIVSLETNEPLPFATVTVLGTDLVAVASENGEFRIDNICEGEIHLEIRFVGYKTFVHHHDFHHPNPVIYMAADETVLESIIVEGTQPEELQSLSVQRKEISKLSVVGSSIGDLTEDLSGVSILKTGSNISKPIVHGLHSNRVLVINNGVRHAYQVWGQEHAPEIDPSHVDQIEIVKGAGTVKYGPEALGGVILYNSKKPALDEKLYGSVGVSYHTNGRAPSSQISLGQGSHRFAWNVGAFGVYQGDLEAPDYNLSNTGKREYGGSFNTLLHLPKLDLQVSGNYFQQELGILRASIVGNLTDLQNAVDRGNPEPTFPFTYDIGSPGQETEHGVLKADLSLFAGDHVFKVQYAIQQNVRREFDVRRGPLNDRPVIDLKLLSHTIDTEWIQPTKGQWSGNSGIQVFTQNSVNEPGSNPANFVPDYDVFNIGAYTIQTLNLDRTTLELGARFDWQSLSVADTIRDVFIYSNEVDFSNATFTLGVRREINKNLTLFSNIGTAWRPPNVAELYSFGYHNSILQFGLWRYDFTPQLTTPVDSVFDQTLRPVSSEQGIKWVSGLELKKGKTTGEFIVYANHIDNFIFLRPFGITTNIRGPAIPFFLYDQTDALFIGSDWDIRIKHSKALTSEVKISYVYATDRENKQALLEIPPLNINYLMDYKKGNWDFGLDLSYTARQWNAPPFIDPLEFRNNNAEINIDQIFDYMDAPDAYFLIGTNISYNRSNWNAEFKINNLLNSSYRIYTDRTRYFADAPGRNFSIALEYRF